MRKTTLRHLCATFVKNQNTAEFLTFPVSAAPACATLRHLRLSTKRRKSAILKFAPPSTSHDIGLVDIQKSKVKCDLRHLFVNSSKHLSRNA